MAHKISLKSEPSRGFAGLDAEIGRITVLLGANGSGKSSMLRRIVETKPLVGGRPAVVYVVGNRVSKTPEAVEETDKRPNMAIDVRGQYAQAGNLYGLANAYDWRVRESLRALHQIDDASEWGHFRAFQEWEERDKKGEAPVRPERFLAKLFGLFRIVFPDIELVLSDAALDAGGKKLRKLGCSKYGQRYDPMYLSDGECQVLCLLADLLLAHSRSLVVVDEPELHLNPHLARRLWDTIELLMPDAAFIYATHCLSFAMRSSVQSIIVLGGKDVVPIQISDVREIGAADLEEFLGTIPSIVVARRALAIEGHDESVDTAFYRWLADDDAIAIVPFSRGCESVRAAVQHADLWERVTTGIDILGIIDRDYRSDTELGGIDATAGSRLVVLPVHEVESFLCDPDMVAEVASKLGTAQPIPSATELLDILVAHCQQQELIVAAQRASRRAYIRLEPSIPRKDLPQLGSELSIRQYLRVMADNERAKVINADQIEEYFQLELNACRDAIANKDVTNLLRLFPGKRLAHEMALRSGCKDTMALLRAAKKHLCVADWAELQHLRQILQRK